MSRHKIIKPWNNCFKVFLLFFSLGLAFGEAQNTLKKELEAHAIERITVNGNQIFNISVTTAETDYISVISTLDGEYQSNYQIVTKLDKDELALSLESISFEHIPDDKRNAHKVIAAELKLEIPNNLSITIFSDIGSVSVNGHYNLLSIELLQGFCKADVLSKSAIINTIDGNIDVITKNARIKASSKNGEVIIDSFGSSTYQWSLTSINGDITVVKKE